MRFLFEYRTSDNVLRKGVVKAPTRDLAYSKLKAQGIKPSRLNEAPGLFNKLFGKCKRWIAIIVLAISVVVLCAIVMKGGLRKTTEVFLPRMQLYGDPYVIEQAYQNLWRNHMPELGDSFLALYAVPGHRLTGVNKKEYDDIMRSLHERRFTMVEVYDDDLEEVAKMKKMVNGMKLELQQYIDDGGNVYEYAKDLVIRAKAEIAILREAERVLRSADANMVENKNRELRAMGLPMIAPQNH